MDRAAFLHCPLLFAAPIQPEPQKRLPRGRHGFNNRVRWLSYFESCPSRNPVKSPTAGLIGKLLHRITTNCTRYLAKIIHWCWWEFAECKNRNPQLIHFKFHSPDFSTKWPSLLDARPRTEDRTNVVATYIGFLHRDAWYKLTINCWRYTCTERTSLRSFRQEGKVLKQPTSVWVCAENQKNQRFSSVIGSIKEESCSFRFVSKKCRELNAEWWKAKVQIEEFRPRVLIIAINRLCKSLKVDHGKNI